MDLRTHEKTICSQLHVQTSDHQLDDITPSELPRLRQSEIACQIGLSQAQISKDLEKIAEMLSPKDATDKAKRRDRLLAKWAMARRNCGPRGSSRGRTRNLNKRESFASRAMQERGVRVQKVQQDIDSERRPAP
jgi:hypothetical protein